MPVTVYTVNNVQIVSIWHDKKGRHFSHDATAFLVSNRFVQFALAFRFWNIYIVPLKKLQAAAKTNAAKRLSYVSRESKQTSLLQKIFHLGWKQIG